MNVLELEAIVFELEQVRIVIRAPARVTVKDFIYKRQARGTTKVMDWISARIKPLLESHWDIVVVNGNGQLIHWRTTMETLRSSYIRE